MSQRKASVDVLPDVDDSPLTLFTILYLLSGPAYTIERMREFDPTMPILSTM